MLFSVLGFKMYDAQRLGCDDDDDDDDEVASDEIFVFANFSRIKACMSFLLFIELPTEFATRFPNCFETLDIASDILPSNTGGPK